MPLNSEIWIKEHKRRDGNCDISMENDNKWQQKSVVNVCCLYKHNKIKRRTVLQLSAIIE